MSSNADNILNQVLADLKLVESAPEVIYQNVNQIVGALQKINAKATIEVGTTGTITERLCEYGLKAAVPDIYRKLDRDWKWIGDFYIEGAPFNTVITVKSFKAKERLLSSGTGNLLSPTLGYGLFDDPSEFTMKRLESYLFRAFFIIFMPQNTLDKLDAEVRKHKNVNQNPFLRSIDSFVTALSNAVVEKKVSATGHDRRTIKVLDPRKL